jgi:hypothetical protein
VILGARVVGEKGFSENVWVASRPLAGLAGMAIRYFEALVSTAYPIFLMTSWLTAIVLISVLFMFIRMVWLHRMSLEPDHSLILFFVAWWAIASLPNMLDASPRLLGLPTCALAAGGMVIAKRLFRSLPPCRPQLVLISVLFILIHLQINGRVQACFTEPVYKSTLQYDINDRRRWPFSDLENLRYEIRQTVLKLLE